MKCSYNFDVSLLKKGEIAKMYLGLKRKIFASGYKIIIRTNFH